MQMRISTLAVLLATTFVSLPLMAIDNGNFRTKPLQPITLAVFGDWPYSQYLLDNASLLQNSVNNDASVNLVLHVGDIHSGSMACTSAGFLPPLPNANPGWNQAVYTQLQRFHMPVVYTPGDNEWVDCHKSKQKSSGDPLKELGSVRDLFFARPGKTLGLASKDVWTQAQYFDPTHPTDAQFVENVMWEDSRVVFATMNIPGGSNNDTTPWTGIFDNPAAQAQEVVERTNANLRWLQKTFDTANRDHAHAVVIAVQADMWDTEAPLDQYTPFVIKLANLSVQFGKPVLLLNGDSHVYFADKPLAVPGSTTGMIHHTQAVPNLQRIVVQGSTTAPGEWLKLTIDPR
ncbi:MAG: metallophosphoesterase, partial [Arenimonas sp.]